MQRRTTTGTSTVPKSDLRRHEHRTTFEEQRAAFEYFKRHADQKYSTIDCLSFVVMESLSIHEALAVDEDFTHSFVARPGPPPRRS